MAELADYGWHAMSINVPPEMEDMVKYMAFLKKLDRSTYIRRLIVRDVIENCGNPMHLQNAQALEEDGWWLTPRKDRRKNKACQVQAR